MQHFCEIHGKQNFAICSTHVPCSDIPFFAKFIHTQHVAIFTVYRVSLQTLRSPTHRNLHFLAPRILRFSVYRKPHHKFLQNFPLVDVSQVAMVVSSQSSERVTREGSFAKGFRNVIWFSKRHEKNEKCFRPNGSYKST